MNINYQYIADAMAFYKGQGYTEQDVPWMVRGDSINVTLPENKCIPYIGLQPKPLKKLDSTSETISIARIQNLCPVASGEQSFIDIRKKLGGKYVCATPCFRLEDELDEYHQQWFFKVELIYARPSNPQAELYSMLADAIRFFSQKLEVEAIRDITGPLAFDTGPLTFDIVSKKGRIELGSYGIRSFDGFDWVYGTGCAEPRLSQAIALTQAWNIV